MIGIKSNARQTYAALDTLLKKYHAAISSVQHGNFIQRPITVVLTGHVPDNLSETEDTRFAFIDIDLKKAARDLSHRNLYKTASCKYSKIIKWNGNGVLPDDQRDRLGYEVKSGSQPG